MRRSIRFLVAGAVVAACLAFAGSAWATKPTVCSAGCSYTSINAAISAATPGATITIGPGSYSENIVVKKEVTLEGKGNKTIIYPSFSAPTCGENSTLCGGAASTIIVTEANNVTIKKLWLKGANPSLGGGVEVGGETLNARNGIVENYGTGVYNNLTVSQVKVTGVYRRGIYASSEGTGFNFNNDTVENVQGEEQSIAIFAYNTSGVMAHNKVTKANDGLVANWSKGIEFLDNTVTKTASAIHTDNNGGAGGTADLIKGNTVKECTENGYGIWIFAPSVSATVESNAVKGCYVGLADYGSGEGASGQGPTFSNNTVNGKGAATNDPEGTYGAYLSTSLLGYGSGDLTVTLTGNTLEHSGTGILVEQSEGGHATVTASGNSIIHDGIGANGEAGTIVNAQSNWWGCTTGPHSGPPCDAAIGTVLFTPWLTAKP
jgi:hypothetical protein